MEDEMIQDRAGPAMSDAHANLLNRILNLVGEKATVVIGPNISFDLTPQLVFAISEPLCRGDRINIHGSRGDGSQLAFEVHGMRHFYRMLKPPSKEAQLRYLQLWHRHARKLADTRGFRYAVKDEPVFCSMGHPIGLIRHHVINQEMITERHVLWRMPESRTLNWVDVKPSVCSWCGTPDIRPAPVNLNQPAWYMVDGPR